MFCNHHIPYGLLKKNQVSLSKHKKEIALALPVSTRWQSNHNCLNSLLKSVEALQATVVMPEMKSYLEKKNKSGQIPGLNIKSYILSDQFWQDVQLLDDILKPYLQHIIMFESNKSFLSRIYTSFQTLLNASLPVRVPIELKIATMNILTSRWSKIYTTEMLLAAILDVNLQNRIKAPDRQQWAEILEYFKNYFKDIDGGKTIMCELMRFCNRREEYADETIWALASSANCIDWWASFIGDTQLSLFAQQLLSITPSSGSAERSWSTFGYLHSKSRNRLGNKRVEKLVFIYSNYKLIEGAEQLSDEWFDELEMPAVDINVEEEDDINEDVSENVTQLELEIDILE